MLPSTGERRSRDGEVIASWNLATVLCWTFLHLQKLPWYFNNCWWFNGPSGRQQHWYSWVCATHIIAHDALVRRLSFRNQGGTYFVPPSIPACSHMLACLSFCVPWLQLYCLSSLQYSSFRAGDQGRCREEASCVHLQDTDKSFSALILHPSFSSEGAKSIDFHSAETSVLLTFLCIVAQKKWPFPLFTRPLQLHVGSLQKVLSWCPNPAWCLLVNVVSLIYFKTSPLQAGTDCTE